MTNYIAFLRGINVSGHNMIKMGSLKNYCEELNLYNIKTYLQSGNIVFQYTLEKPEKIALLIQQKIKKECDLVISVFVITREHLFKVVRQNPFLKDASKKEDFFHVSFLYSKDYENNFEQIELKKKENEAIVLVKDVIYIYCPDGYGQTKLTNNFIEQKLKVGATTRNWKTVNAVLNMGKED